MVQNLKTKRGCNGRASLSYAKPHRVIVGYSLFGRIGVRCVVCHKFFSAARYFRLTYQKQKREP